MITSSDGTEIDIETFSARVAKNLDLVPWKYVNSNDLAASGETRYEASRLQTDVLKIAAHDPKRAGRIWDEHVPSFVPRPEGLPPPEKEIVPHLINAIEPGRRRGKPKAEPNLDRVQPDPVLNQRDGSGRDEGSAIQDAPTSQAKPPDPRLEPRPKVKSPGPEDARLRRLLEGLDTQYLKADDKYHFRDRNGDVAFEAMAKKLLTQHETPGVVASMIDLAETRGWSSLRLTGTQEFRKEAWLQANLRGFEVSGYQPTKLDRARLDELRAERHPNRSKNIMERRDGPGQASDVITAGFRPIVEFGHHEPRVSLTPGQDQFLRVMETTMRHRGDTKVAIAKARDLATMRLANDRIYVGKLVEVGTAPYQDKPGQTQSHFVALEDETGKITKVWGVDIPRALEESGAKMAELVAVAFRGRKPVEVDVTIRDKAGKALRVEKQTVDRNTWEVVQFDRLRRDAKEAVVQAVQRQEQPAQFKVFDRNAPFRSSGPEVTPTRPRSVERHI